MMNASLLNAVFWTKDAYHILDKVFNYKAAHLSWEKLILLEDFPKKYVSSVWAKILQSSLNMVWFSNQNIVHLNFLNNLFARNVNLKLWFLHKVKLVKFTIIQIMNFPRYCLILRKYSSLKTNVNLLNVRLRRKGVRNI